MKERDLDRIASSLERIAYLLEKLAEPPQWVITSQSPAGTGTPLPTYTTVTSAFGLGGPSHDEWPVLPE